MFYQNIQEGYQSPGMYMPPQGYMMNSEYSSYGPNMIPQNNNMNNDYEDRISRLERQVKILENRVNRLANTNSAQFLNSEFDDNNNMYMI